MNITYKIEQKEDGTYLAIADLDKGSIILGAENYADLKNLVKKATQEHMDFCKEKNLPLPENPQIRLVHSELLYNNPNAEKILITANPEENGYRAKSNDVNVDLSHSNINKLKAQLSREIKKQGYHNKHVEFRLEEIL